MPLPGMTTRAAQPPGGRSSISFDDGSSGRLQPLQPYRSGVARGEFNQPPGGVSNVIFDDRALMAAEHTGRERRHTNGLKKMSMPVGFGDQFSLQKAGANNDTSYAQPPGGRSSFSFSDASTIGSSSPARQPFNRQQQPPGGRSSFSFFSDPAAAAPRMPAPPQQQPSRSASHNILQHRQGGDDALDSFLAGNTHNHMNGVAERRTILAPPGGYSSFSLGWGGDNGVNHHHAYKKTTASNFLYPSRGMPAGQMNGNGSKLFGGAAPLTSSAYATDPSALTTGSSLYVNRPSVAVAQPPGGKSQIVFG